MFLGGAQVEGTASFYFKGSIKQCVITEENQIIQDLRPCIDPKGVVCFYDMITKKYFYNQGTGTLTAGNKIKFVDYVEFDEDYGVLFEAPLVDATVRAVKALREEAVHGRWEEYQMPHIMCCSECDWATGVQSDFNYCPNCGAKMDLEDK
jgi:hypothetical protein